MGSAIDELSRHLMPALAVVFRFGGLAIFAPILASISVPGRVRVFLFILLGLAVYPTLAAGRFVEIGEPFSLGALAPLIAGELLIGAIIGFLAVLPMAAMQMGGLLMAQQMGLGFARIYNPAFDDESDVVEQMFFFLGLATFIGMGGMEQMVDAIVRSFHLVRIGGIGAVVAVGGYALDNGLLRLVAGMLVAATDLALRVAAPLLCLFFLETIAMGFVSKSVPSLNILALGFPLRIMAGLSVMVLGMGAIGEVLRSFMVFDFEALSGWLAIDGPTIHGGVR